MPCLSGNMGQAGKPLRVRFNGEMRPKQELAAQSLLHYDNGILNAATTFGRPGLSFV